MIKHTLNLSTLNTLLSNGTGPGRLVNLNQEICLVVYDHTFPQDCRPGPAFKLGLSYYLGLGRPAQLT